MIPLILLLLGQALPQQQQPPAAAKPSDAQQARYYRLIATIERARTGAEVEKRRIDEQAKQIIDSATKEVRALLEESKAAGCELVENEKGLSCAAAPAGGKK